MHTTTAHVATENAGKYIGQLCKHWSHKFHTKWDGKTGQVDFPGGPVHFRADGETLTITIEARDEETSSRMEDVVQRHLDRFAYRETPLKYIWS